MLGTATERADKKPSSRGSRLPGRAGRWPRAKNKQKSGLVGDFMEADVQRALGLAPAPARAVLRLLSAASLLAPQDHPARHGEH